MRGGMHADIIGGMHADIQTVGYRPACRHMVNLSTCGHVFRRVLQCGRADTLTYAAKEVLIGQEDHSFLLVGRSSDLLSNPS